MYIPRRYITSGESLLSFDQSGKLCGFYTNIKEEYAGLNPFKICIEGEPEGPFSELTSANCLTSESFSLVKKAEYNNGYIFTYKNEQYLLEVEVAITPIANTGVFSVSSSVRNIGYKTVTINRFSSAFITGFGGKISRKTPSMNVHYFESAWQAEARHIQKTIEELGLTFVSTHYMSKSFTLLSQGAYTTAKYFPAMYVEDKKTNNIYFINAECDGGWRIQLGHSSGYEVQNNSWYLESEAISSSDIGYCLELNAGKKYVAPTVLFGCVKGGMDEATAALTLARREIYTNPTAPLMFNDYMNCLWCNVDETITKQMVDTAYALGAEGYCIDSGWFLPKNKSCGGLGDWNPSVDRFPTMTLKGIADYVRAKGMVFGLWTELEVCSEDAEAFSFPDEYFICHNGKRVGGGERYFFNMQNKQVRDYLTQKIKALYDIGVRYIKNDFNSALRWINDGKTLANNQRAAANLYKSLTQQFPDLFIENCGSGGMRAEYGMLKYFHIQSTSDQEIYYFNPPIIQGMVANMLPEHSGVWSYPMPKLFDVRQEECMQSVIQACKDGRETVFNMVNGMAGNLYLSGRVDCADEYNTSLIKRGVDIYKQIREFQKTATPVYPNGFADVSKLPEFTTLGMLSYDKKEMYLFFWRFGGKKDTFTVPLKKWKNGDVIVQKAYPEADGVSCIASGDKLQITAKTQFSSAIFKIIF